MQSQNRIFADLSQLATSIAGTLAGAGREAESRLREKLQRAVGGLDMVSRDEFEAVKEMASEMHAELARLKAELAELRGKSGN